MHESLFLADLAIVLCVAAITTVVFRKLRQPVVLGYLLAGVIVGPHTPVPLFASSESLETLAELGVILVMFSIGLEFSLRRLVSVFPRSGLVGLVEIGAMLWLGYITGRALGWPVQQCFFAGALVSISSTMIIAKVFAEHRVPKRLSELVMSVLIIEDLAAILMLAILTVQDLWRPDRGAEAELVYGTTDPHHAGVRFLLDQVGPVYLAGEIEGLQLPHYHDFQYLRHTPGQLREHFQRRGWRKVIAFQTRNPMHRAHFEMTLQAAREREANLLIHPVAGMTKRLQTFPVEGITVTFDPNICIHSGVCVRGLPAVFDVRRKRWIHADAATPAEVAAQIARCPSGALKYEMTGGGES